jgi:hypothetical protein
VEATSLATEQCDVELHLGIPPRSTEHVAPDPEELIYASTETNAAGVPDLRIVSVARGEFVRIVYEDGTEFWLDRKREHVWVTWPVASSLEYAATYLLGPVLGQVLRLRRVTCLHASAVALEGHSVAFVGATGAGKSTTAAAFARQGFGIQSDDIVALAERDGTFRAMPAYPYLCLWPESVKMLYDSPEALPRIIPGDEKRLLALGKEGTRFESRPLPLGAIYLLGDRRLDPAPYVETVRAQVALVQLLADTHANKILDRELRGQEFEVLSRLVEKVPIRRVFPHSDPSRIGDLCRVIREDFVALKTSARAHV